MSETVVVRTNVLPNPSFELDALGWTGGIGRSTVTAGRAYSGPFYAQMGAQLIVDSGKFPASPGQPWTALGYLSRGSTGKSVSVQPIFFDAANTELDPLIPTPEPIPASNVPTKFRLTRTAPAGTTQVAFRLRSPEGIITFDAMMLVQDADVEDYFDGDTVLAGHTFAWTGTPHASASTDTYTVITAEGVVLKQREAGAWVERTATPKVRVGGAWATVYPKRWDAATGAWIAL